MYIGTRSCEKPTLYNGVDMDTIECIPSGQGGGLNVEVIIDGQTSKLSSSPVQFSYYRPSVSSISPANGPTSGRLSFVTYSKSGHGSFFESDGTKLVGRNTSFLKDVKHKGAWIRYLYNVSGYHVTYTVSERIISDTEVQVKDSRSSPPHKDIKIPRQSDFEGFQIAERNVLTISGNNFGTLIDRVQVVLINGENKFNVPTGDIIFTNHTVIQLYQPTGFGRSTVQVTVSGQRSSTADILFTYDKPVISSVTPYCGTDNSDTPISCMVVDGSRLGFETDGCSVAQICPGGREATVMRPCSSNTRSRESLSGRTILIGKRIFEDYPWPNGA